MSEPHFDEIVTTLYEKDYYIGVASLINSLYNSNYNGLVYVGYRDNLPPWLPQLNYGGNDYYYVGLTKIKFKKILSEMHFGYYKCSFLKDTINSYVSASKIYYFDPDIVITAPWNFFSNWVENGVALCLDNCFHFVHNNHPWRNDWRKLALVNEESNNTSVDYYVNSGFIGLRRSEFILIDRWIDVTEKYKQAGGDVSTFEKDGFRSFKGDQDLLNAAITISADINFSIIGKEGMGFTQPAYLMSHAVSNIKPWKKNFLGYVIKYGIKPNDAEKKSLNFYKYPICILPRKKLALKKFNLKIASIVGRIAGY